MNDLYRAYRIESGNVTMMGGLKGSVGDWVVRSKADSEVFGIFKHQEFMRIFTPVSGDFVIDLSETMLKYQVVKLPEGMTTDKFAALVQAELNKIRKAK